ncbi:MAG: SHOCT domain-containing protein [Thermoleophilia bacterium]
MMDGWGWGGYGGGTSVIGFIFMVIFMVAIIAGIVLLIIWLVRQTTGDVVVTPGTGAAVGGESALDILKKRYANGEIDKAEFDEKKKDLTG